MNKKYHVVKMRMFNFCGSFMPLPYIDVNFEIQIEQILSRINSSCVELSEEKEITKGEQEIMISIITSNRNCGGCIKAVTKKFDDCSTIALVAKNLPDFRKTGIDDEEKVGGGVPVMIEFITDAKYPVI